MPDLRPEENGGNHLDVDATTLGRSTLAALLLAVLALTLVVLPQAYGIDPTGLGQAMGFEPAPAPLPEGPNEAFDLVLAPGLRTERAYQLEAGQALALELRTDAPVSFTLTGTSGEAIQQGVVDHATNTTFHA
ncbi:MAG: hypothetical protein R3185_04975, partial [Candidatus Thermoplasmatota archaeon]|nr:hypothetical protein [Candidatus Thermoplasmatota archaeon]